MMLPSKVRTPFKIISCLVAGIFLFQQVAWAGDLIDTVLNKQTDAQAQTFAPSYLQNQQAMQESVIGQKQDAENFASSVSAVNSASSNNKQQSSDDASLPLKGPRGGRSASIAKAATASAQVQQQASDSNNPVLSVTTAAGDVINYKNNAIDSVQKKDGTVLTNIVVDANNNLVGARITYKDGTVQIVANGKVSQVTKPDGTLINYNDDESIASVVYPAGTTVNWSYTKDNQGNITQTTLTDPQKTAIYGSDNKLQKVVYNNGETIAYQSGVILSITEADLSVVTFDIKTNLDGGVTSSLLQYLAANGDIYRYKEGEDGSLTSVTVEKEGMVATYDKDGKLVSLTKDGQEVSPEDIVQARTDYNNAVALYQSKKAEAESCKAGLDAADADLIAKTAAKNDANSDAQDSGVTEDGRRLCTTPRTDQGYNYPRGQGTAQVVPVLEGAMSLDLHQQARMRSTIKAGDQITFQLGPDCHLKYDHGTVYGVRTRDSEDSVDVVVEDKLRPGETEPFRCVIGVPFREITGWTPAEEPTT